MKMRYAWCMPHGDTFRVAPIRDFVKSYLRKSRVSIDPFARNRRWTTWTNDLNPVTSAEYHMDAREFLRSLVKRGVRADLVLMDPPYSPRQVKECYAAAGLEFGKTDAHVAALNAECRRLITRLIEPGGIVLSFGWNTAGMGKKWTREEILIVCHGGAHNDTLCVADRFLPERELF